MGQRDRRTRRIARRRKEQTQFTEPLTQRRANRISRRQANLAYRPTERTLQGEIRGYNRRGRELTHWYNSFANKLEASRQMTANAYQQAGQQLQGVMQTANTAAQQVGTGLSQEAAQRQATTGIEGDPRIAAMRQAAMAQSAAYGAALQAPIIGQAANTFAFQGEQANASRLEGQRLKQINRRARKAEVDKLAALRQEKGDYRVEQLNKLREADRAYKVQQAATGQKNRELAQGEREEAFNRGVKERELNQEGRKIRQGGRGLKIEEGKAKREAEEAKTGGGRTPSEIHKQRRSARNAFEAARSKYQAAGEPPWGQKKWNLFIQALAMEEGIDYVDAVKAVKKLRANLHRRRKQAIKEGKGRHQGNRGIPGAQIVPYAPGHGPGYGPEGAE